MPRSVLLQHGVRAHAAVHNCAYAAYKVFQFVMFSLPPSWNVFDAVYRERIETFLRGRDGAVDPQRYVNLAGDTLKGGIEQKLRDFIMVY